MAIFAVALGAGMVWLDAGPGEGLLDGLGWYQKAKPDGAHQVLSTIAGSMITVAGVVFSITIVAIGHAASQFGPRVLTNFMSDRGNQVTLGTFIATFVYCLVVLRTIRGGDEGEFVPQLAVMVGLFLALCSIAVLIFFIHHVPRSIHINSLVAQIGRSLLRAVDERFPQQLGVPSSDAPLCDRDQGPSTADRAGKIASSTDGYIELIDDKVLLETARARELKIFIHRRPGDYTLRGQKLMSIWPQDRLDDATEHALQGSVVVGNSRTPTQDVFFFVDELVEIAARALSAGINDPYTAVTCLDWLAAATARLSQPQVPKAERLDEDGTVRVVAPPESFAAFVERGFGRMRSYLAKDVNAAAHGFDSLAAVGARCVLKQHVEALQDEARKLHQLVVLDLRGPSLDVAREHYVAALKVLDSHSRQTSNAAEPSYQ